MILLPFSTTYKDELSATAVVIGVTVIGSFLLLGRITSSEAPNEPQVLGAKQESTSDEMTTTENSLEQRSDNARSQNDEVNITTPSPTSTPSPSPSPTPTLIASPSATPIVNTVEIPYGANQNFENEAYVLKFSNPRLVVGPSHQFRVDLVLANKNISAGIENSIFAVITKNGQTISSQAPLSLSEFNKVMPNQQLTYSASINLPPETQITQLQFMGENGNLKTTYNLQPPN